jgi:hypothetical protein
VQKERGAAVKLPPNEIGIIGIRYYGMEAALFHVKHLPETSDVF